jgi:predicted ABC-type sugar transport system permease subunit
MGGSPPPFLGEQDLSVKKSVGAIIAATATIVPIEINQIFFLDIFLCEVPLLVVFVFAIFSILHYILLSFTM